MEQHGVAVHVKVVDEHRADTEAGELDRPAPRFRLVSVQLLDQQHVEHGHADPRGGARHPAEPGQEGKVTLAEGGGAKQQQVRSADQYQAWL